MAYILYVEELPPLFKRLYTTALWLAFLSQNVKQQKMKIFSSDGGPNSTGTPFISEFHYDNAGSDTGEFIEVCAPAGTSLAGYQLVLYNDTTPTQTIDLGTLTACPGGDGNDYFVANTSGIPNGPTGANPGGDAIALVNTNIGPNAVCEFISYEGITTAVSGPAAGMTSTDIGVAETSATPVGYSLQLNPSTGQWQAPMPETPKLVNICFFEGTKILTIKGYKKIEELNVDDLIKTSSGKELPIKWIGIQSIDINSNRNLLKSNPVLIEANALGEGIPSKDLKVSPNHAVFVDGLLINAGALVNGENIYQEVPLENFKYYHIELDSHELVIAENTPAESYLPQNENRDDFDNAAEFDQQYPDGRKLILWPLDFPRISSQAKVPDYIKDKILRKEEIRKIA